MFFELILNLADVIFQGSEPNFGSRMEALLSKHESGPEVLATVCLGLDDKQLVAIKGSKGCLLSDSIVELKEKCMQILGAHLLRHQVPLEEPDLDILDEYVGDEGEEGKDTAGAAPLKKKSNFVSLTMSC